MSHNTNAHFASADPVEWISPLNVATLPDAWSPVGSCPDLDSGWHSRVMGPYNSPALVAEQLQRRPPIVSPLPSGTHKLVVFGHEAVLLARLASLATIPVTPVAYPVDVALLCAAHELLHDPSLHGSTERASNLATFLKWLEKAATVRVGGSVYRVGPILFDLLRHTYRRGSIDTVAYLTGCSPRSLRSRHSRTASPAENVATLDRERAHVLVSGDVDQMHAPGDLHVHRKVRHRSYQLELPFSSSRGRQR